MICLYVFQNHNITVCTLCFVCITVPCPEMIRPPENIRVLPGQTADFYCLALSYSGLLYRWRRYDKHFITNTTTARWLFLRHYTAVQHLFIANVQLSDEGRYCCEAINECGLTKGCAWLNVLSKYHLICECISQNHKKEHSHSSWLTAVN